MFTEKAIKIANCNPISHKRRKFKEIISLYTTYVLTDIDECENETCHDENATCFNTEGSFSCRCNPGFTGDGDNCSGEIISVFYNFVISNTTPHYSNGVYCNGYRSVCSGGNTLSAVECDSERL